MKRDPIDKWSIREQLCLVSAVVRSGDQNWMSVSRALKQFAEPNRPSDWFSQKNCAAQYGSLLKNVETPKRKKRASGSESLMETPGESILRKLVQERKLELKKEMEEEKREYLKLRDEMDLIKSGAASDGVVEKMCAEIDEEEKVKEQDAIAHAKWLKMREEKILELERVFRASSRPTIVTNPKRKLSETSDTSPNTTEEPATPETSKPALSPLLTSLLKTPAHVPNVTSSILHTAITSQRGSSPTIASLLNTSASVPVSASLQQLVTTAISQEPPVTNIQTSTSTTTNKPAELLAQSTAVIPPEEVKEEPEEKPDNTAEEDSTVLSTEQTTADIKIKEEIAEEPEETKPADEIIEAKETESTSETKEINVKNEEEEEEDDTTTECTTVKDPIDVYDFDEEDSKSLGETIKKEDGPEESETEPEVEKPEEAETEEPTKVDVKTEPEETIEEKSKESRPASVEIVEVVVMEEDDSDKEMNKKVSEIRRDIIKDKDKGKKEETPKSGISSEKEMKEEKQQFAPVKQQQPSPVKQQPSPVKHTTVYDEYDFDDTKTPEIKTEPKEISDTGTDIDAPDFSRKATLTPELSESFYDDMSIQVTKADKSGKAKRDYSRLRKKEDKDLDILIAVDKVVDTGEEHEGIEETSSEKDSRDSDRKSDSSKNKLKDITERSNSPWTEEEEILPRTRRRLSATPATPCDSIPNSPASGNAVYDDDRDYRTWKKSVMLVYSRLIAHKYASLFLKPITDEQAPGYHDIVYRPMDLQTIRKNIENGNIRSTTDLQREVMLIFQNAIMYNKRNESVYNMAKQMQQEALQQFHILLQAQAQAETPVRRETRTSESGLKRKRGQEDTVTKSKKRKDD